MAIPPRPSSPCTSYTPKRVPAASVWDCWRSTHDTSGAASASNGVIEEVGGAFGGGEQALHLDAELRIVRTGPVQELRPGGCLHVERQVDEA